MVSTGCVRYVSTENGPIKRTEYRREIDCYTFDYTWKEEPAEYASEADEFAELDAFVSKCSHPGRAVHLWGTREEARNQFTGKPRGCSQREIDRIEWRFSEDLRRKERCATRVE